ncbi:hypothetical protein F4825DRAFT_53552 [Nemania diffusa]|nr:hypothetical protein F4825DRAFT_53552 [Nemania diffusa]
MVAKRGKQAFYLSCTIWRVLSMRFFIVSAIYISVSRYYSSCAMTMLPKAMGMTCLSLSPARRCAPIALRVVVAIPSALPTGRIPCLFRFVFPAVVRHGRLTCSIDPILNVNEEVCINIYIYIFPELSRMICSYRHTV